MNGMCDVYVYEDVSGGYTTHIARNRKLFAPIPSLFFLMSSGAVYKYCVDGYVDEQYVYKSKSKKILYFIFWDCVYFWEKYLHDLSREIIPVRKIGLPFDGETFNDETALDCADRLEMLRDLGYKLPQYAIDSLREEE
jgi:hypothetical protein